MPRVRKYHKGGTAHRHPHPTKPATRQDSLDLYNSTAVLIQALKDEGYRLISERKENEA